MRRIHHDTIPMAPLALTLALGLVAWGCSEEDSPVSPGAPGAPSDLPFGIPAYEEIPANPDGVLLRGASDELALGAVRWMRPTPTAADRIADTGWLQDKLIAAIHPTATVAEVNAALSRHGITILSMSGASPVVVLLVETMSTEEEARALGESLAADGAFVSAGPAFGRTTSGLPGGAMSREAPPNAQMAWHFDAMNAWTGWNLARGVTPQDKVTILTSHTYAHENGATGVGTNLQFLAGGGTPTGEADLHANDGYLAAGLMGGLFNGPTPGIAPDDAIQIGAFHAYGLSMAGIMHELGALAWDSDLDRLVLFTPAMYSQGEEPFDVFTRGDRAIHALQWRILLVTAFANLDVLHVVPAGLDLFGDPLAANYQSPWALAAREADLLAFAAQGGPAEADKVRALWQTFSVLPGVATASPNTILVGASDLQGNRATWSARPADVLAPGVDVTSACAVGCDGDGLRTDSGTWVAASLVAGLAGYMWGLNPELTELEVIDRIRQAYVLSSDPGFVDAYLALLSTDTDLDIVHAPARMALLDVAGSTLGSLDPNGVFDDVDIATFLEFFRSYEAQRQESGENTEDYSRFDLNGDHLTGGAEQGRVDLDGAYPMSLDEVPMVVENGIEQMVDETWVTDRDVLCYFAYSPLYAGDEARRLELLGGCAGPRVTVRNSTASAAVYATDWLSDAGDPYDYLVNQDTRQVAESPTYGSVSAAVATDLEETRVHEDEDEVITLFWDVAANISVSESYAIAGDGSLQSIAGAGQIRTSYYMSESVTENMRLGEPNFARGRYTVNLTMQVGQPTPYRLSVSWAASSGGTGDAGVDFGFASHSEPGYYEGVLEPGTHGFSFSARGGADGYTRGGDGGGTCNVDYSFSLELGP